MKMSWDVIDITYGKLKKKVQPYLPRNKISFPITYLFLGIDALSLIL